MSQDISSLQNKLYELGNALDSRHGFSSDMVGSYVKYAKLARKLAKLYFDKGFSEIEATSDIKEATSFFASGINFESASDAVYLVISEKFLLVSDIDERDDIEYIESSGKIDEILAAVEKDREINHLCELLESADISKDTGKFDEVKRLSLKAARLANDLSLQSFNTALYSLFAGNSDPEEQAEITSITVSARNKMLLAWIMLDSM